MSLVLNCKPVMNLIAFELQTTFRLIMLFSAFVKAHGLAFDSEPNNTTTAAIGSNQTFTWKLSLGEKDKSKQLQVQFGPWDRKYKIVKSFFMIVKQEPSGENKTVARTNQSTARRLHWNGDLSRDYYIAFELVNIQRKDAGDYGIRLRVDHFPPTILQNWFSLIVQDPTPTPYIDTRHITLDVAEGDHVNITCRTSVEARSSVLWFKDKVPVYAEQSKFLSLTNVSRLQGGNYSCVSINQAGNTTSPVTTINVLYKPKINFLRKLKRSPITLRCEADGNPSPTFYWHKDSEIIREGFNSSWNASTLTVSPVNDKDSTRYVCTAKNKIGWDALAFQLHKKGPDALESKKRSDVTHSSLIKYASLSACVAIVGLVCALLIQRHVGKRHQRDTKNDHADEIFTHSLGIALIEPSHNEAIYSEIDLPFSGDSEWEIAPLNLKVEKVIGHGAFGVVSRGLAFNLPGRPGWTVVAVKSVQEGASEKERRDLLSEMSLLKQLDPHPHVIRLYGCVTTEERPLVVVEYAQFGDLLGYLRKSRGMRDNYYSDPSIKPITSLTSKQLLKFAWEISNGMEYLSMKKIIHRDLAARNVLVGEGEVCKITDFGMARDVQEEDIYVRTHEGRLPIKWTAPEALIGSGAYTTTSDVWSYGVVLYEIFTVGGDPFPGVYMKDMLVLLKKGYRMPRPKFISPKLYDVMMKCWKSDPSHRPSFGCLSADLRMMMKEEEQEYVNLEELLYKNVLPINV
ncbi:unnamed protein product [Porites evermanni]|uniref:receptor protein-tyrosine kinase n=1 Tax=Porites evermanni TaxID=104178 RepID=A0ABN8Q7Y3_9CNID|nr:unnamed protein product [Porites evermanni]